MQILSVLSFIFILASYVPYIQAIRKGTTKPAKASWVIWGLLDTIILAAMIAKGTVNYQIVGTIFGVWTVMYLAVRRGEPGWTNLDKFCLTGSALAVVIWQIFDSPTLGLAASLAANFIGSIPTLGKTWDDPKQENKLAWTLGWISCVLTVAAVPTWSLDVAGQPLTFLAIQSGMMILLFIKPRLEPVVVRFASALADRLQPAKQGMGNMTLVFSVAMVFVGFPMQIYNNWQKASCGIHLALIILPLGVYGVRIPYQISIRGWHLIPADVFGCLFCIVLLGQWFIY